MSGAWLFGAVAGGLVAGLGITAMLVAGERKSGKPSELAELERASAARLGLETPADKALPGTGEQAVIQGGHLFSLRLRRRSTRPRPTKMAGVTP